MATVSGKDTGPMNVRHAIALTLFSACASWAADDDPTGILNFRAYSDTFASSGQPSQEQLRRLSDAGYSRVVYLAFSNSGDGKALADEDVIVTGLGMEYLHIPVVWDDPRPEQFETFAAYMRQAPQAHTLLHCMVNARASAFSFLYRVIYQGVPVAQAKADMNTVWQPNATWRDFIFAVLERHGIPAGCDGCDWTPSDV